MYINNNLQFSGDILCVIGLNFSVNLFESHNETLLNISMLACMF
jgi:hypothetical protein